MAWGKGGSAAWRVYDSSGQAVAGPAGAADGVPAWGLVSALADPAGGFLVIY